MLRLRQISAAAALASIALLSGCRLDMHVQPQQNPLSRSDFFTDQRSERPPVEGTVARGQLHEDTYFYTGKARQQSRRLHAVSCDHRSSATRTRALQHLLRSLSLRGRRRQRLHPLARFHAQAAVLSHPAAAESSARLLLRRDHQWLRDHARLRSRRSRREDRWKIVAYIRALQLSQNATRADVPTGQPIPSEPPKFHGQPGSGATLPVIGSETTSQTEEHK